MGLDGGEYIVVEMEWCGGSLLVLKREIWGGSDERCREAGQSEGVRKPCKEW